jgi:hypothetical protein
VADQAREPVPGRPEGASKVNPEPVPAPRRSGPLPATRSKAKVTRPDPDLRRQVGEVLRGVHADTLLASFSAKPRKLRFVVETVPQTLRAAGMEDDALVWRMTGPILTAPPLTAAGKGPASRSGPRSHRRKPGTAPEVHPA